MSDYRDWYSTHIRGGIVSEFVLDRARRGSEASGASQRSPQLGKNQHHWDPSPPPLVATDPSEAPDSSWYFGTVCQLLPGKQLQAGHPVAWREGAGLSRLIGWLAPCKGRVGSRERKTEPQ